MTNHYHLVIETLDSSLSRSMPQLNGVYTQRFNRHHGRVEHVFQGRYKAILVNCKLYLLELIRSAVLNSVRAGMVTSPEQWRWSSYQGTAGQAHASDWLATARVLRQFGTRRTCGAVYRFCSSWCPSCDHLCVPLMRLAGRPGAAASARWD